MHKSLRPTWNIHEDTCSVYDFEVYSVTQICGRSATHGCQAKAILDDAYYCRILFSHTFLRVLYPKGSVIPRHLATRVPIQGHVVVLRFAVHLSRIKNPPPIK